MTGMTAGDAGPAEVTVPAVPGRREPVSIGGAGAPGHDLMLAWMRDPR